MPSLTETTHAGGFILSSSNRNRSFENGKLNLGQKLDAGTVLGQLLAAGVATAVGAPTGNGAITIGASGSAALAGIYKLVCVAAVANAGTFNYYAPDGSLIRQITVGGGAHASDHFTVTIADGAADFVVGDTWTFEVTAGDYEILAPAGTNGTQIAAAVLYAATDATTADTACTVVRRHAEVNASELIWPAGISAANKAAATAALNARGIFLR